MEFNPEPTAEKEPELAMMPVPVAMPEPITVPEPEPENLSDQVHEPASLFIAVGMLVEYEGMLVKYKGVEPSPFCHG